MKSFGGLTLGVLVAAAIACTTNEGAGQVADKTNDPAEALAASTWRPTSVGMERLPDNSGIYVNFSVDGKVSGFGGCNQFFGGYELSDDGLNIGSLGASRKYCMEPVMSRELGFIEALQQAQRFSINAGKLELMGEGGDLLVELVPASTDDNA